MKNLTIWELVDLAIKNGLVQLEAGEKVVSVESSMWDDGDITLELSHNNRVRTLIVPVAHLEKGFGTKIRFHWTKGMGGIYTIGL